MAAVVEEDVGEVARLLPVTGLFAAEHPVETRGGDARRGLEAFAVVEGEVVDQCLCAEVVADEVAVAGEEGDGELAEEFGEDGDGGFAVGCGKGHADLVVAFFPASLLVLVDVQGEEDVFAAQVRAEVLEVRWPVHAARFVCVGLADVVHVDALLVHFWIFMGRPEELVENKFASLNVYCVVPVLLEGLLACVVLCLQLLTPLTAFSNKLLFVCVWKIRQILVFA